MCDFSIGTPVDPVPDSIQQALAAASNAPGYPTTHGQLALREAFADWQLRALSVSVDPQNVLPTLGSKELVAGLPHLLGLGHGDTVVIPETAYPTYEVGALISECNPVRADSLTQLGPVSPALIWLNSPSNPTGKVLPVDHLKKVVDWARERDVIVASDECYIELGWEAKPTSILHPDVCGGDHTNLLAVHSLSKRSNLAGYRDAFVTGDPQLIAELLELRKHIGMMLATPLQAAAIAALTDDDHVKKQRVLYASRREALRKAFEGVGFRIEHSEAGLYLWATRDEDCWDSVKWLAERGIVVAPGAFYGPAGSHFIRIAITETDDRVAAAVMRLS